MYFYLKEPNSNKETIILLKYYVSNSKKYFQISTKLSINPNNWNFKSRSPIIKRGLASVESRQLTHQLNKLDELLQRTINKYGADLTKEHLTETFKPKKNIANNVIELYSEFLKEKKQQGTVTARTLQKYNVVFLKYKSFCAKQFKSHKIKDLDDNFYVAFLAYLRHKDKLNDNTLARYLTFFKTFVIWCNRKGFDVNNDYTNVSVKKYQSADVSLKSKEVEVLENADLNGSDEKARDEMIEKSGKMVMCCIKMQKRFGFSFFFVCGLLAVNPVRSQACSSGRRHVILKLAPGLFLDQTAFFTIHDVIDLFRTVRATSLRFDVIDACIFGLETWFCRHFYTSRRFWAKIGNLVLGKSVYPTLYPTFSINIAVKGSKSRKKICL